MSTCEIVFGVISAFFAVFSIILSLIALKKSNEASRVANGDLEIQVRNMLREAKKFEIDVSCEILSATNRNQKKVLEKKSAVAHEELLNAYEEACSKYLDNKIDKKRFRKSYCVEIRNIVQKGEAFKDKIDSISSPYYAIKKVYDEWENPEKN